MFFFVTQVAVVLAASLTDLIPNVPRGGWYEVPASSFMSSIYWTETNVGAKFHWGIGMRAIIDAWGGMSQLDKKRNRLYLAGGG